jgi:excisionase family DNA binding protein
MSLLLTALACAPWTQAKESMTPTLLLTTEEAAARLRVSVETLATWRCTRRQHIPFVKVGSLVRYKPRDIAAYLDSRLQAA